MGVGSRLRLDEDLPLGLVSPWAVGDITGDGLVDLSIGDASAIGEAGSSSWTDFPDRATRDVSPARCRARPPCG